MMGRCVAAAGALVGAVWCGSSVPLSAQDARAETVDAWYLISSDSKPVGYIRFQRRDGEAKSPVLLEIETASRGKTGILRERYRQWCKADIRFTPIRILIGEINDSKPRLDVKLVGYKLRGTANGEDLDVDHPAHTVSQAALFEAARLLAHESGKSTEFNLFNPKTAEVTKGHKLAYAGTQDVTVQGTKTPTHKIEHSRSQEKVATYYITSDRKLVRASLAGGRVEMLLTSEKAAKAAVGE